MRFLLSLLLICFANSFFAQQYELYKKLPFSDFESKNLGYDVNIEVTVPLAFDEASSATYPIIFVFDKQNNRSYNYILATIDYLTANDQMPLCIVVGVEAGEDMKRYNETQLSISASGACGEKNEAFIFDELLPMVRKKYRGNQHLTLIGHSRYGYYTSLLLTRRAEEIGAVISLSPFLWQENVDICEALKEMTANVKPNRVVYYRFSMGEDFPNDYFTIDSMLVKGELNSKYFDIRGELFPAAGHTSTPGLTIAPALYDIFEFWAEHQQFYFNNSNTDFEVLETIQQEITEHYGQELNFSLGILNGKGWFFYNDGKYELAIRAWEEMLKAYPKCSDAVLNMAFAQKELNQDTAIMLALFKKSLATDAFYTLEEKEEILEEVAKENW
jgi:predicted alpha/beta superfamily hydrolase